MTDYNAIPCPTCGGGLSVVSDTRPTKNFQGAQGVRRTRRCNACNEKHKTIELLVSDAISARTRTVLEIIEDITERFT